jgi:hypothetical protein
LFPWNRWFARCPFLPPKADILSSSWYVRFVPKADIAGDSAFVTPRPANSSNVGIASSLYPWFYSRAMRFAAPQRCPKSR